MEIEKPWDTQYEWRAVALLTLGFGLVGLDRWIIAPLAPSMMADLNLSPQDINNLVGLLGVAWGIAAVLLGGISDRIGRKRVLIPAIVLFSLLSGLSGVTAGIGTLLLIRAVMGVSEGAFCPTSFACTAEASKSARRGFNQGLQQSTFALFGLGFGPIIATQLLHYTSWRVVFLLVAVPGLVLSVLLAMVIREPITIQSDRADAAPTHAPLSEILKHRNIPLGMLGLLCAMCGIFVLSANTPIYLTQYLHLSNTEMGSVTSAIGFGGFCGQWGLPAFSDFLGRRTMAIAGFIIGAIFLWLFMQAGPDVLLLFVLLFIGAGFSFGLLALITGPIATEAAPLGLISTAAGLVIGTGEIFGGGIAPVIAGSVAGQYGIQYTLYMALAGLLAGVVVSLFLQETAPRKAKPIVSNLKERLVCTATTAD